MRLTDFATAGEFDVWMQLPQPVNGKLPWTLIARAVPQEDASTLNRVLVFPVQVMPAAKEE